MKLTFNKLPPEFVGVHGPYYLARAVDTTGKWEVCCCVMSRQNLPKFIMKAEKALEEQCSEVCFHGLWKESRDKIMNGTNNVYS